MKELSPDQKKLGRRMKSIRQSTVEPVFGTLIEHLGMRKMNTIGIRQSNKNMLLAAVAYNLKKYLSFDKKNINNAVKEVKNCGLRIIRLIRTFLSLLLDLKISR